MPDYSAGTAYLSIIPTLLGDKASLQRQIDTATAGISATIPMKIEDSSIVAARAQVEALTSEVKAAADKQVAANAEVRASEDALNEARARGTATETEVSNAENRVTEAHAAAARAGEDATGSAERLGNAQSSLTHLLDEQKKSTDNNSSSLKDLKKGADSASDGIGSLAGKAAGFMSIAATGLGLAGLVQGALSLTSALIPAVGAVALLPAAGIAGAAAIGTLKIGTQGFGAALKDIGTPKFAADLAKLSPSARDAATGIASLKPAYDSLQQATQNALFMGLGTQIRQLGAAYLPIARGGFVNMATSINGAVTSITAWMKSAYGIQVAKTLTDGVTSAFHNVSLAIAPVVTSLITIGAIGAPILANLTQGAGGVAGKFAAWVGSAQGINTIRSWIEAALNVLKQLGEIVGNVGQILLRVLQASSGAGANMLGVLVQLTGGAKDFLNSAQGMSFLKTIFDNIHTALMAVQPLVAAVGNGLKEVLPPVSAALVDVGKALGSLAPEVPKVVDVIKQLAPIAGQLAQVLAGALTGAIDVLAPIVRTLASALSGMMPTLKAWAPELGVAVIGLYAAGKAVSGLVSTMQGISSGVTAFQKFFLGVGEEASTASKLISGFGSVVSSLGSGLAKAGSAIADFAKSETLASAATKIWSGIQIAFDAIMDANPIALLIIAIVALIAVVVLVVTHFQTFKDIVNDVWNFIKSTTASVWGFIVSIFQTSLSFIENLWNTVWGAISSFFTTIWNAIRDTVMTVWNAIVGYLTAMFLVHYQLWMQIWGAISGFFTTVWDFIKNTAITVWNAISGFFVGAFNAFVAFFEMIWNREVAFWTSVWNFIRDTAVAVWNAVVAFFTPALNAFSAFFQMVWNGISSFFTMVWNFIKTIAVNAWNGLVDFLMPAINAFSSFFSTVWNAISSFFSMIWTGIKLDATTLWNDISSFFTGAFNAFSSFFSGVWNGIRTTFSDIWNGISADAQAIWNGIIKVVKDAVNGVIGAANGMVGGVNKVLTFLLIPAIPTIPPLMAEGGVVPGYAAGTNRIGGGFKTNGPTAIVGEGRSQFPEYVIPTDPQYRGRATALHAAAGADLGMPKMADGGILGTATSWLGSVGSWVAGAATSAWDGLAGAMHDVTQWVGSGFGALENMARGAIDSVMPPGMLHGAGDWIVNQVFPAIQQKIIAQQAASSAGGAFVGPGGAAPAGVIGQWISQALAILGYPQNYALGIAEQIHSESGGNPNAIQGNIGDVNNASGDLAKGIMQVISTTFASNALPGHGNIFNPVDNIIAGSRYAMAKYGASWFEPGAFHNHGYATGGILGLPAQSFDIPEGTAGILPEGLSLTYNGTGSPETLARVAQGASFSGTGGSNGQMVISGAVQFDPSDGLIQFTDARVSGGLADVTGSYADGPR